jgi:hypothetical protein
MWYQYRVAYAVNWALRAAGAEPGKSYSPEEQAELYAGARNILSDIRNPSTVGKGRFDPAKADPKASEAVFLRDAQRYLYGRLGGRVVKDMAQYYNHTFGLRIPDFVPDEATDRYYEEISKPFWEGVDDWNERHGSHTTYSQTNPYQPPSPLGGGQWFSRGLQEFNRLHPENAPARGGPVFLEKKRKGSEFEWLWP